MPQFNRILLTGAAGSLGRELRSGLAHLTTHLRLADRADMGTAAAHEELVQCDLSDPEVGMEITRDVDAIVHFAGVAREQSFNEIMTDTIPGTYNMFEGARKNGVKRVIFASSIHAVGYYRLEEVPDTRQPHRPDSFYGMAKCFGEDLASLYWNKFGVESVCLRICSALDAPKERRNLWSWLSFPDTVRLVERSLTAPRTGHSIIFGTSANSMQAVSNAHATHIGYDPQDTADAFRDEIEAQPLADHESDLVRNVGGFFTNFPHPDDAE
ncbi:NAD-dependent epimerase/dehydratase family protein [Oceanomicrobium pacificus]|uniref:NAD-dependent epimerase/dehydratase family protein n=1 Tax=Oceanomicrobium pacificus TaxID=2692916 RepID=A0A6B0TRY6_9RHOB|nr:NAD(P)-dependent oxidoreductase [Oceanomicrobium pacificus]MXU64575.1 NAD-dependent epimerase/dehydratase family protein [Oceanomicrobium pacificus]